MRAMWRGAALTALCGLTAPAALATPSPEVLVAGAPLRVLWNSKGWPDLCPQASAAPATALLAHFGVRGNARAAYYGPEPTDKINTMGAFGAWPSLPGYVGSTKVSNGGIPQRGNLSRHLEAVAASVRPARSCAPTSRTQLSSRTGRHYSHFCRSSSSAPSRPCFWHVSGGTCFPVAPTRCFCYVEGVAGTPRHTWCR